MNLISDRKHIWVFDNPRARSHVFFRWLSTHPDLKPCYHPYVLPAHFGPGNFYGEVRVSAERRAVIERYKPESETDDSYESATATLEGVFHDAEAKESRLLIADHCHRLTRRDLVFEAIRQPNDRSSRLSGNPTLVPDKLLAKSTPIFVIRNPLLAVSSFYAGMAGLNLSFEPTGEDMILQTSLKYCRMIFEYFHRITGTPPLVVDGEDITWRRDEIASRLCKATNLDVAGLSNQWEPTPTSERPTNPYIWRFTQDMHESTGIRQAEGPPQVRSVEAAEKEWAGSYGDEVAGQLRAVVEANMDDYRYLLQFKI